MAIKTRRVVPDKKDATASVGFKKCADQCGLKRDRWERVSGRSGVYYRCRDCKRFIGWIRGEG